MAQTITLTNPVAAADLKAAHPRSTRAMEDPELVIQLRLLERAIRSHFGVTTTSAASSVALADAMLAAWPSFQIQVAQVASKSTRADAHSVTYANGKSDFTFPGIVGTIIGGFIDEDYGAAAPTTTRLERC